MKKHLSKKISLYIAQYLIMNYMEEEKSLSELNKANANIIINNSENNNEIVYNQNISKSFNKSYPNLNIGNLNSILIMIIKIQI